MVRKKPRPEDSGDDRKHFVGLTPNQVVAYNLALAREIKGWTQDQAAEALEPYLGVRWSKASVSQAERSVAGGFVRNFTADEIVAFARCYGRPVTWFFMPPPPLAGVGVATRLTVADAPRMGENVAMLVDLVFGDRNQQYDLCRRLDAFLAATVPGSLTDAQHRIAALADQRVAALVRHAFTGLGHWQTSLRSLANQLEDLEARSKLAMASQLKVDVDDLGMPPGAMRHDAQPQAVVDPNRPEADSVTATAAEAESEVPRAPARRPRPPAATRKKTTRRKS